MIQRLTGVLDWQSQALELRSERQRLIASNIANADTPGYVARDFDFARALREANGQPQGNWQLPLPAGAVPAGTADSAARFERDGPRLQYALAAQNSLDGNTVDMDRERSSFVDNALKYESTLRFINGSVRSMLDAMKSHNQG